MSVKWMRIFEVTDTSKHPKGFMLFKVTSMLYPEKCPEAVTKLTVWKRYNDFKKLHKDMKILHDKYSISSEYPVLPRGKLFRKYDEQSLNEKKTSCLNLLEYVGDHYELFTSQEFLNFFETSYTPSDNCVGNIHNIRADLHLPDDPELLGNSDDDSLSTASSIGTNNLETLSTSGISTSKFSIKSSQTLDNLSIDGLTLIDDQTFHSDSKNCVQYILDASVHVKLAEELENGKDNKGAFLAYKTALDILTKNYETETNYERKRNVRYQIEKYRLRAEKIYNIYLAPEVVNLNNSSVSSSTSNLENEEEFKNMSDLYKYKIVQTLNSGTLAVHSDSQEMFYVKVLNKTTDFDYKTLILPKNIPFMVQLYNYFNCDNALFLILEYIEGVKLLEHIEVLRTSCGGFEEKIENFEVSDNDSIDSFIELVDNYTRRNEDKENNVPNSDNACLPTKNDQSISLDEKIIKWCAQLVLALEKLHTLGITCKYLSSNNLLVDAKGDLKLTYFCNLNSYFDIFESNFDVLNVPPEILSVEFVGFEADLWCLGAIFYEIIVGMKLSHVHNPYFSANSIIKVPTFVVPEGRSLLKQLLVYDPMCRLGAGPHGIDNLKSHPFFKSINWAELSK